MGVLILEEIEDSPDPLRSQSMRRICDPKRIILGTQLAPELALAHEVELSCNCLVRVLQHLDLRTGHVVARREGSCGASPEGQRFDSPARGRLDGVREDVLNGAVGGARKVEEIGRAHV